MDRRRGQVFTFDLLKLELLLEVRNQDLRA